MERCDFYYQIFAMVKISGHELQVLVHASENHYDKVCKSASRYEGFLYGMVMRWIISDTSLDLDMDQFKSITDEQLERTEEHRLSCLLYTSPSPRDGLLSRMPSSA